MDTKHPNNDEVDNIDNIDLDRELEKTSDSVVSENEITEVDSQTDTDSETSVDATTDNTQAIKDAIEKDVATTPPVSRSARLNKYFLYTLVAGLIISALISIVAVLVGEFNSTMARALGTTGSMVGHTLFALMIVSIGSRHSRTGGLILNALLAITIASFITSLLAIWDIVTGRVVSDLYLVYFYTFSAVLWVQLLLKVGEDALDKATRITSFIGIGLTALLYALLVPTVFIHYPDRTAEFHLRALAASAIALATASVLAIVFHRIHLFKHPDDKAIVSAKTRWDVIMAVVVLFLGLPLIFGFIAAISSYNNYRSYESTSLTSRKQQSIEEEHQQNTAPTRETSVDCADLPQFQSPKVMRYVGKYVFVSNDEQTHQLTTNYEGSTLTMEPMTYTGTLKAVDADCNNIDASTIKPDDTVQLYLRVGYSNFYKDALALVQKVD